MEIFDKKVITLNNGEKDLKIKVYLKEVRVRNDHRKIKAFCRILNK